MRTADIVAFACLLTSSQAAVVEIDVQSRSEVLGGRPFGSVGSYERITGRVRFAVDPTHAANKSITDIERVPRNSDGLVEFSADLYLLRPNDLRKGNGTVLFEVLNRGNKRMLPMFNRARPSNSPASSGEIGDGLLLNEGYTLVWLGWQHDVPEADDLMRVYVPLVRGVKGTVRSEYTAERGATLIPLGDARHIPYQITDERKVTVSIRHDIYGERKHLRRTEWALDSMSQVVLSKPAPSAAIYEVIYESSDPPVAGLGLAAIRDLVVYLKRDHEHAIGFGISQSAMVLRAFLYEGFNQDEQGKQVFDGIFAHVGGARRSTFQRFTQPSRTAGPLRNASLSPTEQFPFSDAVQRDHTSGVKDGLLAKAASAKVLPKIFYTNSTYEYWGSGASLLHTTPDGGADVQLPPSTRMYVFAGGQHGPAGFPPKPGGGQNLSNFNDYRWPMRALLKRLQAWVSRHQAPPESIYPKIAAKTLVPLEEYKFPAIAGVTVPAIPHVPHSLDFGPYYRTAGIITREPPRVGRPFGTLVPQADADGNDLGGLRMPEIDCAIGTFTGWNLRHPSIGLERYLLGNTGSYLPFPQTSAERAATRDPRRAIEAQYPNQGNYIGCVDSRSDALIATGVLLPSDKQFIAERAAQHWQWRMQQPSVMTSTPRR